MPAWDVRQCVIEAKRVAKMGLRGINMTANPDDVGGPDLANRAWDPFWEACAELELPVHFHIGSSESATKWHGSTWASQHIDAKMALGATMLFIGNAQVLANLIVSGIFDRHPGLKVVSVESGIGWIPFVLEAIEYELAENAPAILKQLGKRPIDYFRSNIYGTFWFERNEGKLMELIDAIGEDNIMFETDFPHPTCLYPDPLWTVSGKVASLPASVQAKIMGENARKLYRL
jgi:predicted TIM-barrel fold metal-dependent hydrolase